MNHFENLTDEEIRLAITDPNPNPELLAWACMFRRKLFHQANRTAFELYDFGEFKVEIRD